MLTFDKELVRNILIQELGFPEDKAERGITLLSELHEELQPLLDQWLLDRTISDHKINGVSLDMVYKYFKVDNIVRALNYIDMFADSKSLAEKFLRNPYLVVGRR